MKRIDIRPRTYTQLSASGSMKNAQGFTLLEVLVSLIIIAVGLLGIAGMNALAISNSSVTRTRSLAGLMAEDLAARISANKAYWAGVTATGVPTGFTPPNTISIDQDGNVSTLPSQTTDCTNVICTPLQMAAYDLREWGHNLVHQSRLPGGAGTVTCNTGIMPIECTIKVSWTEKPLAIRQAANSSTASLTLAYEMLVKP